MALVARCVPYTIAFLLLLASGAAADNELNVSSSTNGLVINDPDRNPDIVKVELRSFGSEFRYVVHQRKFGQKLETGGTGCRPETKESGDQATISCVRLFGKVFVKLGGRRVTDPAPNHFEVPASFPDPIDYRGEADTADTVIGGLNADLIFTAPAANPGDTAPDDVQGMGGDDNIKTAGIAVGSTADGGEGNDAVSGGPVLRGGPGNDELTLDLLFTMNGVAIGGDGNDHVNGSDNADVLVGGDGNDHLEGNRGDDLLQPGRGSDISSGGNGTNRFEMSTPSDDNGADSVFLQGSDTLDYHLVFSSLTIQGGAAASNGPGFARVANQTVADKLFFPAARIVGGHDDDVITDGEHPGTAPHRFEGGPGNDTINAGDGPDELFGGPGADVLRAGAGDDLIDSVDGIEDTLACGAGLDFAALDLVDPDTAFTFGGKTPQVADVCEGVERANRKERPNVNLLTRSARLAADRTFGVRLRCPARAAGTCRGRLTAVLTPNGARAPHATLYAVRRGKVATLRVRLTIAEAARAHGGTAIVKAVEKGRFGPKTTTRLVGLR